MNRKVASVADNLFENGRELSRGELLFYKLFELFIMGYVIKMSWDWGVYTLRNQEVVLPLGLANYIDVSFMFGNSLPLILAGIITLLTVIAFFRIGTNWIYLVVLILFHFQHVTRFSQGEIPHSANLIGMTLFCFAIGIFFFRGADKRWRFIFGSMIFFIGLGYTSAAISKLIGTGITWADGRHLWLWMAEKGVDILSREGEFSPNWLQSLAYTHVTAATLILLIGWVTEWIGILMWWKKFRPYVITAILGMHFGITLTMNIRFDAFVMQLILVGYPWYLLLDRWRIGYSDSIYRRLKAIA